MDLWLDSSSLGGSIPKELSSFDGIEYLYLGNNPFLQGPFPDFIYNLTSLIELRMEESNLSGVLSGAIGKLASLEVLHLEDNDLSSAIPAEIGNLKALLELFLEGNEFASSIPSEIGLLASLEGKFLQNGTLSWIPFFVLSIFYFSIFWFVAFAVLTLQRSGITGTIPAEIGNLNELGKMRRTRSQTSTFFFCQMWFACSS